MMWIISLAETCSRSLSSYVAPFAQSNRLATRRLRSLSATLKKESEKHTSRKVHGRANNIKQKKKKKNFQDKTVPIAFSREFESDYERWRSKIYPASCAQIFRLSSLLCSERAEALYYLLFSMNREHNKVVEDE
jgi:hypothetical protein